MKLSKHMQKRLIEEGFDAHFVKDLIEAFRDIPTQDFARLKLEQIHPIINKIISIHAQSEDKSMADVLDETLKVSHILQMEQVRRIRAIDEPEDKKNGDSQKSSKTLVTPNQESKVLYIRVQLIDADTKDKKPLSGFKVKVSLLDGKKAGKIAEAITDKNGIFSFHYFVEEGKEKGEKKFMVLVLDSQGKEIHTEKISIKAFTEKPLIIEIPMSAYRRKIAIPIEDLTEEMGYSLPTGLFSVLKKNKIETLEDIRTNKGIKHLEKLPVPADHPDVKRLEGHAYLHTLSEDIHLNDFLIKKNYTSPSDIGDGSLTKFIKDTSSILKEEAAEHLWKRARSFIKALDLIALNHRIENSQKKGVMKGGAGPKPSEDTKEPCLCQECDSAVSPRAYLMQLLDYAIRNLDLTDRRDETDKDIFDWLSETFCLSFEDLSFSCEAMREEVLQIRLCIEVLRCYLDDGVDIEETIKAYCLKAYKTLLTQIGTSRDELRLMRGAASDPDEQLKEELEALERRLGFRLRTESGNRLQELNLNLELDSNEIEKSLHDLFGLPNTDGTGPRHEPPLVAQWRKEYLRELWQQEDRKKSETTWDFPIIDPDLIGLDDLRLPNANTKAKELWEMRRIWVDERLDVLAGESLTKTVHDATGEAFQVPDIQKMFMTVMVRHISHNRNTLVRGHTTWYEGTPVPDPETWWNTWSDYRKSLSEKESRESTATDLSETFYLTVESFERLMQIWEKDRNFQDNDPFNKIVTPEESNDLIAILVQTQKKRFEQTWKDEEAGLILGSADFWQSLTEPSIGEWPPQDYDTRILIDPDLMDKTDLRDVFGLTTDNGKAIHEIWQERKDELKALGLEDMIKEANIELMLERALSSDGSITIDLESLSSSSNSRNYPSDLENSYYLLEDELRLLMDIKAKIGTATPPFSEEWEEVIFLMKSVYKRKSGWKAQEASLKYWEILKAKLPKWRADAGIRQKWQAALKANSSMPIIEPDVIFPSDITDPTLMDIQEARAGIIMDPGLSTPGSSHTDQLSWFQIGLKDKVGFLRNETNGAYEFDELARRYIEGQPVLARLQQIGMPINAFARLTKLLALLLSGQTLYDKELEEVKAILSSVLKRRLYAQWRKDEANIILDPDKFTMDGFVPENVTEEWYAWRFDPKARERRLRTLEARSAQLVAINGGLKNGVLAAEEAALPILRRGLVEFAYKEYVSERYSPTEPDPDYPREEGLERQHEYMARFVTDYFLIDAETGTCKKTTRLQQAIEILQIILWSARTGLLQDKHPKVDIKLLSDDFDEDWKWIGSYATWRAAMFMFLYPQNILLPTLRKPENQSPGFKKLVKNARAEPLFTPKKARELAREYSDYYRDICNLSIEATCEVNGFAFPIENHSITEDASNLTNLLFKFGRAQDRGYFSISSCGVESDSNQSFWSNVPGFEADIERIFGTAVYNVHNECPYLYVFGKRNEQGKSQLVFNRYDLEKNEWDGDEFYLIETPFEEISNCLIDQTENRPPTLLVQGTESIHVPEIQGYNYSYRSCIVNLGVDGIFLDDSSLTPVNYIWKNVRGFHICSAHRILILYEEESKIVAGIFSYTYAQTFDLDEESSTYGNLISIGIRHWSCNSTVIDISSGTTLPKWFCSFAIPSDDDCIIIAMWSDGTDYSYYREIRLKSPFDDIPSFSVCSLYLPFASVGVPKVLSEDHIYIAGNKLPTINPNLQRTFIPFVFIPSGFLLLGTAQWKQIAPQIANSYLDESSNTYSIDMFSVTDRLSQKQLQLRRIAMLQDFERNRINEDNINIKYMDEAYFSVPILLAHFLNRNAEYQSALDWYRTVYDFVSNLTESERDIYAGLTLEETLTNNYFSLSNNWLDDPLDLHRIASTRGYCYTQFTLQSIIRCLLDYADAEFTFDTSESIARARDLYLQALSLLDAEELQQATDECEGKIADLELSVGQKIESSEEYALWTSILEGLKKVKDFELLQKIIKEINNILNRSGNMLEALRKALLVVDDALNEQENLKNRSIYDRWRSAASDKLNHRKSLLMNPSIAKDVALLSSKIDNIRADFIDISDIFCVPPNPVPWVLRLHSELNLHKIRTCRNIAGMERELKSYAAPTDTTSGIPSTGAAGQLQLPRAMTIVPTRYRYPVLMERAKQLVSFAQQMEAAFLSVLEKYDAETYNQLKARQDVHLARAGVKLLDLRVTEAGHGVTLANLQKHRAEIQEEHYNDLLEKGNLQWEDWALYSLWVAAGVQGIGAVAGASGGIIAGGAATGGPGAIPGAIIGAIGGGIMTGGTAFSTVSQALSMMASFERREQEWKIQKQLANQDIAIGNQQITIAQDRERIVGQEYKIAEMQSDFANDVVEFLNNKFTSAELYDWMSGVLEEVYRYFLQQATAMAKLSENQLAFERQEIPPSYIQNDYWEAPSEGAIIASAENNTADRRGLTGSSRLLMDIFKLDQHAFETDKRKLQLTKTISLIRLDPFAYQKFLQTGVMVFETPMRIFDQDFPGHYLRLIKRVRTSVIALIPPTEGIRAKLQSSGISRVVIRGHIFQETTIRRDPESVALTSPLNATGLFELQQESHMMLPFEGSGVDMVWEFRMPKASNPFDFSTIADVLITIEYTALDSYDYRQQVIKQLDRNVSADRAFSFRQQFPDQWYALNNPDQDNSPMAVTFKVRRGDFPPNIQNLNIQQVLLYFAVQDGRQVAEEITLQLIDQENGGTYGGRAAPIENLISTRGGAATEWISLIGKTPAGNWELKLPHSQKIRSLFKSNEIEDILFVITYSGQTPEWPA